MTAYTLAIIGGSGLYDMPGLSRVEEKVVETPFGHPSDKLVRGVLETPAGLVTLLFLPRHGVGHRFLPSDINYRANIYALKSLGATHLVGATAVGSMREEIVPGDFVIADQFVDLTKLRQSSFFSGSGIVGHVPFADPVCSDLSAALASSAERVAQSFDHRGGRTPHVHRGGTYVCIEGPQFSTRAESHIYRSWGVSVIGMTAVQEAKLSREAELPYATLALATDYDCWHTAEGDVSADAVVAIVKKNAALAKSILINLAASLPDPKTSCATGALSTAIMTSADAVAANHRLDWLIKNSRHTATQ